MSTGLRKTLEYAICSGNPTFVFETLKAVRGSRDCKWILNHAQRPVVWSGCTKKLQVTPLHMVIRCPLICESVRNQVLQLLLIAGADPNKAADCDLIDNFLPMEGATLIGQIDSMKTLVRFGADVPSDLLTTLICGCINDQSMHGTESEERRECFEYIFRLGVTRTAHYKALRFAIDNDVVAYVELLCNEENVDVQNEKDCDKTLLMYTKSPEAAKVLIDIGANLFLEDSNGVDAIGHAIEASRFDVVKQLQSAIDMEIKSMPPLCSI